MSDSAGAQQGPQTQWVSVAADDVTWIEGPYGQTAVVWGDQNAGPYGAFNRFEAGTVIPPHTHSSDNQLVVVEGVLHNYRLDDDDETRGKAYPAGSFIHEVAGVAHVLAVDPAGPATVYITQAAPLDLTLVDQDDPGWQ